VALGLACGAAACDGGLLAGSAYDRPLISFTGTVKPTGAIPATLPDANGVDRPTNPIMGLLWTDPLQVLPDMPAPARWLSQSVSPADSTFSMQVFRPPPPEVLTDVPVPGSAPLRLALAEIVMIDDQDGDGTFAVSEPDAQIQAPDIYLAGADTVLVYLPQADPSLPDGNPLAVSRAAGYQLVTYFCDHQTIASVAQQDVHGGTSAVLQTSRDFPDVRVCARTHSP
jgi:hypothetical protein